MEESKWFIEEGRWGQVGRLKKEYKNKKTRERNVLKQAIKFNTCNNKEQEPIKYWPFSLTEKGLAKTDLFEFKFWFFPKSTKNPKPNKKLKLHKEKINTSALEYNFIIEGETEGIVGEDKINLRAGDYIIIKPGFVINLQDNIKKDLMGITIKVPYKDQDDKIEGDEKGFDKLRFKNDFTKLIKKTDFEELFKKSKKVKIKNKLKLWNNNK